MLNAPMSATSVALPPVTLYTPVGFPAKPYAAPPCVCT